MAWAGYRPWKVASAAICSTLLVCSYVGIFFVPKSGERSSGSVFTAQSLSKYEPKGDHLAVIVPFRERFEELLVFVPFLHRFLINKKISHNIIVVNQADELRFNRASLINVGFLHAVSSEMERKADYIAMHDVDLLPMNIHLPYKKPDEGSVLHVAAPGLHPRYDYPTFIGGILLVNAVDFVKVDGMSNIYWGWGLEDDEFYVRLKQANIEVKRPEGIKPDKSNTFRHNHNSRSRPRDMKRCYDQLAKTKKRDRVTGLHNVNYTTLAVTRMTIDDAPVVILNIELLCDKELSPWCDCSKPKKTKKVIKKISAKEQNRNIA